MPELPDVETYKRYLDAVAVSRRVRAVAVGDARLLDGSDPSAFESELAGRALRRTRRHGKHLFMGLDGGHWLVLHFGMTGRPVVYAAGASAPDYTRIRLDFADGGHLAIVSLRLLGMVGLTSDPDGFIAAHRLGPDARQAASEPVRFRELLGGKRGQIKSALMDQGLIAGLGNIYTDEILYRAGLHPKTPVQHLEPDRLERLRVAVLAVLESAVAAEAGWDGVEERLPETFLLAHRREGADCPRCSRRVATIKTGGRTTYFCPACQPAPSAK